MRAQHSPFDIRGSGAQPAYAPVKSTATENMRSEKIEYSTIHMHREQARPPNIHPTSATDEV
jgi:hypothetical protein